MRRHVAGYRTIPTRMVGITVTLGFIAGTIAAAVTR